jgi:hypothetical protein
MDSQPAIWAGLNGLRVFFFFFLLPFELAQTAVAINFFVSSISEKEVFYICV